MGNISISCATKQTTASGSHAPAWETLLALRLIYMHSHAGAWEREVFRMDLLRSYKHG